MASNSGQRTIQSIAKGCAILDRLREDGPTTLTDIGSHFELSAGTIHTYLATFKQYGFVEQDGSKYDIGPMFIPFGVRARNRSPVYTASKTIIQRLAYDTGGCVHLMTEYSNRLLILEEVYGEDAIDKYFHIEKRGQLQRHLHCTAGGKSILAYLPDDRIQAILNEHGLPPRTSRTITDQEELLEELATVEDRGYAINDQEHMPGVRAIGAPIVSDETNEVLGTVSVSVSAVGWDGDLFYEELPALIKKAANEIEIRFHSEQRD